MVHVAQNAACKIVYVCEEFRLDEGVKQRMDVLPSLATKRHIHDIVFLSSFYFSVCKLST